MTSKETPSHSDADPSVFTSEQIVAWLFGIAILAALFIVSRSNFLIFHTLAELFSVVVAWSVFILMWNTRKNIQNGALIYLGVAYFFIGSVDLIHTISYKGMGFLEPERGANPATQLWIGARFMESVSLFIFPLLFNTRVRPYPILASYAAVIAAIFLSIFYWENFPACYIEGVGLTRFKKFSEYIISFILMLAIGLLVQRRREIDNSVYRYMIVSIVLTIFSELAFTFYVSVYGASNLLGHFLKIISFYLVYKAIIVTGLKRPYETIYQNLKQSEQRFRDVISSIPGAVYQFIQRGDGAFEMSFMSQGGERLLGRPLTELMDMSNFMDGVHPDDIQPFLESIQASAKNMTDWRFDFRRISKDGTIQWLRGASSPKPLSDGGVCWSGILTDVTGVKQTERDLEASNKDLLLAQRMAGVGNWSLDPEVGVAEWSDQVYQIYERDPQDGPLPLADYPRVYRGRWWERFHAAISAAINQGTPYDIELKLEPPSGKVKWVRAICEPDPTPGPKGRFLRGTIQDITLSKQAEDALKENNATIVSILENTDDIICFRDREGRLKYYNTAFAGMVRKLFNREPFIGMRTMDYLPAEARRQWRPILERVLAGKRYVGQFQWAFGEADVRFYEIAFNPVQEAGKTIGYSEFNRDITSQKQAEERIRRAKEKAQAANRAKSEFLANMSHEIRTPINSMHGFIQILKDQHLGPLNHNQEEHLDYIMQSSQRLLVLVNDILDLSRVEAGKLALAPAPFAFHRLMERMGQFLFSLAAPKPLKTRIHVASDTPRHVIGDVHRIEQILKNLISNAVKFTEHGEIEVGVENQGDDRFLFKISDTGVGIPKEKQDQLFTKFYQADSSYAKQFAGAGLGLAISRELVEMMKGDIWVESDVGRGSVFYVALTLERADDSCVEDYDQADGLHVDRPVKRCLRILLAEDDELNRRSTVHFLEKAGHAVTTASNGKAVLAALAADPFDIILMDVQMPEMDGVEATQRIRNASGAHFDPRIPIIVLTAYAMGGDEEYFLEAGADDYVSKPIDYEVLSRKIQQLVARDAAPSMPEPKPPAAADSIRELDQFIAQTQDHPAFALEMLRGFIKEAPIRQKNLHAAFETHDLTLIAAMAHKMANLFASLQLFTLGNLSNALEGAAREEKLEECHACLAQLDSGLDFLTAHIQAARYLEDK